MTETDKLISDLAFKLGQAIGVLQAVRSQMCWEADRDLLTSGLKELLTPLSRVLEQIDPPERSVSNPDEVEDLSAD